MGRGGSAEVVADAADVLKPRTDKRDYKCVVLENELQALIISDPDTDKVRRMEIGVRTEVEFELRVLMV